MFEKDFNHMYGCKSYEIVKKNMPKGLISATKLIQKQ